MRNLNHHPPMLTRLLQSESDGILKEVEEHGGQNVVNAVFIVHHLIPTLHLKM
jgi:hypothetical protein